LLRFHCNDGYANAPPCCFIHAWPMLFCYVILLIMIAKPGKDPTEVTSYRPISLLPLLSRILEKLLLQRLKPLLTSQQLIPDHQFGFRPRHGTTEQAHRLVHKIREDFQHKRYCTATFIDISQAFDKVWHPGLLYKLKRTLPHPLYSILKSYLTNSLSGEIPRRIHFIT